MSERPASPVRGSAHTVDAACAVGSRPPHVSKVGRASVVYVTPVRVTPQPMNSLCRCVYVLSGRSTLLLRRGRAEIGVDRRSGVPPLLSRSADGWLGAWRCAAIDWSVGARARELASAPRSVSDIKCQHPPARCARSIGHGASSPSGGLSLAGGPRDRRWPRARAATCPPAESAKRLSHLSNIVL